MCCFPIPARESGANKVHGQDKERFGEESYRCQKINLGLYYFVDYLLHRQRGIRGDGEIR